VKDTTAIQTVCRDMRFMLSAQDQVSWSGNYYIRTHGSNIGRHTALFSADSHTI